MNTNNGWLDIASAPKDGSRVLLWNRHFDAPCSGQFYGFGDWRMDGNLPLFVYQPTHWMPLPAAPGSPTEQPAYTVTVDPDPRGVSVGVYQGSSCVYHGAHAIPTVAQAGHCCERAQAQGIAACDECVRENEQLREAWTAPASTLADEGAKDERQAFEAWAKERGYQSDELARCKLGIVSPEYFNLNTENVWKAWQARASLAPPASAQDDAKRLCAAIEGECGGAWVSEKQALAVLAHLGWTAPAAGDALDDETRWTLRWIMREADAAKETCGTDPESPAAIRNAKLASIASAAAQALKLVRGPSYATHAADDAQDAARWRWMWNHAENVSFAYRPSAYTTMTVAGRRRGSLAEFVDAAIAASQQGGE
ncbi:DUF551 domain-containing protein [Achromobacter marplatensis]